MGLCAHLRTLKAFGQFDPEKAGEIRKTMPGLYICRLRDGRELKLQTPALTAAEFEDVLVPFLERDMTFHRENDYRITCSIFGPLKDALERAGVDEEAVDLCLLVGGSCLIPQVIDAVDEFLGGAEMLSYDDMLDLQTAVARGAAWHALALELTGEGLVAPMAGENVAIRTNTGPLEIIPRGARLPYPEGEEWGLMEELLVPTPAAGERPLLRIDLEGGNRQLLFSEAWELPATARPGREADAAIPDGREPDPAVPPRPGGRRGPSGVQRVDRESVLAHRRGRNAAGAIGGTGGTVADGADDARRAVAALGGDFAAEG